LDATLLTVNEPPETLLPARIVPRLNVVALTLPTAKRYTAPLKLTDCEPALIAVKPLVPVPSDA
jgi:hypothetical protein